MDGGRKDRRAFGAALIGWAAMLAASLVNFLHYQGYPLARGEVALLGIGLGGVAVLFALLHALAGRGGRALLTGLLLFVAIDLNADRLWLAWALGAAAALLAWRGVGVLRFLTLAFGIVLATGLVGLGGRAEGVRTVGGAAAGDARKPLVVEIILDEQAGPAGLAPSEGRWLEEAYRAMGFSVYRQAYSRHYHTKHSLAALIGKRGGLAEAMRGRRAVVTETDYYPLCALLKAARCTTYSASSLAPLARQPIAAGDKAQVLAYHFAGLSTAARKVTNAYDKVARRAGLATVELRSVRKVPQMNAVALVPRLEAELKAARAGDYHLVHLLLPHAPYSYDAECRMLPAAQWRAERDDFPIAERDAAYAKQMRCAAKVAARLVRAVEASPGGRDATIVIHGDHGSRIVTQEPFGTGSAALSEDDVARGYAALFAVRIAGQPARTIQGQAALTELMRGLAKADFKALPKPGAGPAWVVVGEGDGDSPRRRALPAWPMR